MRGHLQPLVALVLIIAGCSQNNPPTRQVTLPADALFEEPIAGLTEPRVTELSGPHFIRPPLLQATAIIGVLPSTAQRVSDVREVILELDVIGAPDEVELSLELLQPDGSAYEARSAPVGGNAFTTYRAQFIVPVAGTAIDRSNLSGTWNANFLMTGQPVASTTFELLP